MAQRRMFSPAIVCSDAFLDMPASGRDLYYQLGMYADDDGFVNPRKIMRMLGSSEDDLKILIAKRFVIPFPSGVLVIKHWKINNLVRKDWYRPTQYLDELKSLSVKNNGSYTELVNGSVTNRHRRLGKVSIGKDTSADAGNKNPENRFTTEGAEVIKAFESVDPKNKGNYNKPPQREAADFLIREYGLETVLGVVAILPETNLMEFVPQATTPYQLKENWTKISNALKKRGTNKGNNFVI